MTTSEIIAFLNTPHADEDCKAAIKEYLRVQLEKRDSANDFDLTIANEIASLTDTEFAKELRKNYMPAQALNLSGYLELPEHHRAGVTWQMLKKVVSAINDKLTESSEFNVYDLNDNSIPFLERRQMLSNRMRQLIIVGDNDPSQQADIANWLAGMLGTLTAREMKDDYKYYECFDMAQKLTLPESERPYGSWHVLKSFIDHL